MKFDTFLHNFGENAIIDSASFVLLDEKLVDIRRQVSGWVKKGYLLQLKKGVYVFNDTYRKVVPSQRFIANYLVMPSYLSLEYALGYYDLIPERVTVYSSLTTKKTQTFTNNLGKFEYCSIKESLFFGFIKATSDNQEFFIALPEKAILDFFYSRENIRGTFGEFEAFRFQNLEILKLKRFHEFSQAYPSRVRKAGRSFINFVKQEARAYVKIR
jgi:predicted transcriptional regulator of viral defense system